jgi:capsular polysaccharide biosynthesis protein
MENFPCAIVVGHVAMIGIVFLLIVMDMKAKTPPTEPTKVVGKRPA